LSGWIIEWASGARDDLRDIYRWLSQAADLDTAERFVSSIIDKGERLSWLPARGSPRPDLAPNMHSIVWRRRVTIAYRIDRDRVQIIDIRYAGRDWPGLLADR
jgi:toxin ParE1/3/4